MCKFPHCRGSGGSDHISGSHTANAAISVRVCAHRKSCQHRKKFDLVAKNYRKKRYLQQHSSSGSESSPDALWCPSACCTHLLSLPPLQRLVHVLLATDTEVLDGIRDALQWAVDVLRVHVLCVVVECTTHGDAQRKTLKPGLKGVFKLYFMLC